MNDPAQWLNSKLFRPHWLLRGGHSQTIYAAYGAWQNHPYTASQHLIATSNNDQLVLHEDRPASWERGDLCGLLIHGLGGCHGSPYMVRIAHKLQQRGICTFRMDMRGCGAGMRLAQQPGHAGRSEDIAVITDFLLRYCPDSPLVLIGVSLGGNVLLKLLGEWGAQYPAQVLRAMAVAPPIDLSACAANIERLMMVPYNRFFLRMLMQQVEARREFVQALASIPLVPAPRTLMQFDDRITARLSGFASAAEYYDRSSSIHLLGNIRVPTVILAANDDPVVPAKIFDRARPSDVVTIHCTRGGGHAAYIARPNGDPDRYWLDWRVIEYVTGQTMAGAKEAALHKF